MIRFSRARTCAIAIAFMLAACQQAPPPSYPLVPETACSAGSHVTVIGQVAKPGSVACTPHLHLVDAIAAAGGFTELARRGSVRLQRGRLVYMISITAIVDGDVPDLELSPDDKILVPETD
jgi:competence protein ComEA